MCNEFFKWLKKWWLLIIAIIAIACTPRLFTLPARWGWADFSATGDIGSTIGGITAPFVGLIGAILLYITFREQRKNNSLNTLLEVKKSVEKQIEEFDIQFEDGNKISFRNIREIISQKPPRNKMRKAELIRAAHHLSNIIELYELLDNIKRDFNSEPIKIFFKINRNTLLQIKEFFQLCTTAPITGNLIGEGISDEYLSQQVNAGEMIEKINRLQANNNN